MELYKSPTPLKPCPFCGSKAELLYESFEDDPIPDDTWGHIYCGEFMIRCRNVKCRAFMRRYYRNKEDREITAEVIAKRWNTRDGQEPEHVDDDYHYNPEWPDKMGGGA